VGSGGSYDNWFSHGNMDDCCAKIDCDFEEFSRCYEWDSLATAMKRILELLRSDRGNVESAMVLIPLLLLFLVGTQIAAATHLRNSERITAQDEATKRAISGEFEPGDEFIHIDSSGDGQNLDLLITHRSRAITDLLPVDLYGFAVVENQR
jgi:hypothetical protein